MELPPDLQEIADEAMAEVRAGRIGRREVEGIWWERRRENEPTADYLSRVLRAAGLIEVARNAAAAHYDDYFCPGDVADGLETLRLVRDVRKVRREMEASGGKAPAVGGRSYLVSEAIARILKIEEAIKAGEFDGTKEESDRWARGESGQAAMRALVADKLPKVGRNDPCPCGSGRKSKNCHGA